MGTAAYMSPEQARGKTVDKRTDIWAFGVVLYEMLTGVRPFQGDDVSMTLASVMKSDVDARTLPPDLPEKLRTVLRRCLEKDPSQRIRDIGDVRLAMEGAFETPVSAPTTVPSQPAGWRQAAPWALGTLVVGSVVTGLTVWSLTGPTPSASRVERFAIPPPAPASFFVAPNGHDIAISPDGTRVVYTATGGNPAQLYVRAVDALTATPFQGLDDRVFGPFISPDSAWVGFNDQSDDTLKKVSILGGPPVTICSVGAGDQMRGATWAPDDTIIFGTSARTGLWRVSASGGEPELLTTPDAEQGVSHRWPHILPGGRAVLFTIQSAGGIENAQIAVLNLDTNEQRVLVPGGSYPRYSPTSHLIYGVNGTLRAVRFDLDRLEVTDPNPVPVLAGVVTKNTGAVNFDLARDGSLVYVAGEEDLTQQTLVWVDRQGNEVPLDLTGRTYDWPRVSPNGTRLVVTVQDQTSYDVWISAVTRGTLAKLTTDPALDVHGLWTPDGERVVFCSNREPAGLFWLAADGSGEVEPLMTVDGAGFLRPYGWTPDGSTLVFDYVMPDTRTDIGVFSMEGDRTWEPLIVTEANEEAPAISPDGQWIAYTSDETGQPLVYVERFPQRGGKETISRVNSLHPMWSPDGRELFYLTDGGDRLMVVPIELGPNLHVGEATSLFEGQYFTRPDLRSYDVSPDGQRFLMIKRAGAATTEPGARPEAVLVKNWLEELTRLVPVP